MNREMIMCSNDRDPNMWRDIIKFILILTFFSALGILINNLRDRDNEKTGQQYHFEHTSDYYVDNSSAMHVGNNGV